MRAWLPALGLACMIGGCDGDPAPTPAKAVRALTSAVAIQISATESETRSVGNVYLVNTIGSISGSLLAGFVLIRLIGSQNGLFLMACVNLAIGAYFLRKEAIIAAVIVAGGDRCTLRPTISGWRTWFSNCV